ncbi:MAG: hypothetical protein P8Y01_06225 [Woeseiaceae bacterium]
MSKYLTITLFSGIFGAAILLLLTVLLWPPGLLVGALLAVLFVLLAIAMLVHVIERRHFRPNWRFRPEDEEGLSESEVAELRMNALLEREQRLELRELQLARQTRALQIANEDYIDILQPDPPAEELSLLVEADRQLIALIELESQDAFDRVLKNRYAAEHGVNTALILEDTRAFVEKVAHLYCPDTEDPLFETDIEAITKSVSSTALHMLVVVDGLPINLKSYNAAKMYRLIRRGASYYGTYKAYRPYVEHGLNVLQAARLALGVNPAAVGVAWAAGKLATHGARAVGERLLQQRALQLLNDIIRVIGFEAAMMYGGDFRHRDANWVLGAMLVNLEISRGDDFNGRDAALVTICSLALRHEFDRIRLLHHLAKHNSIDVIRVRPQIIMTRMERQDTATVLVEHCHMTGVDLENDAIVAWREDAEKILGVRLDMAGPRRRKKESKGVRKRISDVARRLPFRRSKDGDDNEENQ